MFMQSRKPTKISFPSIKMMLNKKLFEVKTALMWDAATPNIEFNLKMNTKEGYL